MKLLGKLFRLILFLILALTLVGLGYYFAVTRKATLSPEKLLLNEKSIVLYDGNGERISAVSAEFIGQTVEYSQIPDHTVRAFVDTEDKRFFTHKGFDTRRIAKAAYNNLRARSFKQGASTISQQLIKNTHLSQEKTLKRKLSEWKLTRQLEKRYSKEEILEKYLSVIYFGHSCFGLRAAADFYFGKTPQELDIADSAILAGLVKSPNNYSPFKNPENCKKRKQSVLNAMLKNGSIDENERKIALEKPLPLSPKRNEKCAGYAHFVFEELTALAEEYGFTVGGNIEISTYMDKEVQTALEELSDTVTKTDKSLCVFDTRSHGFKGYLSTVGEIRRLPGSLIKPLLVYAPALEEDIISPATPLLDEQINYGGYAPNNYDGEFHGYVSARECVAKSLNIPAVKILESLRVERAVHYLDKLLLPVEKEDLSLALALGGMKKGYSLQRLVSAYSALASGGTFYNGGFISEIKIDGNTVYKRRERGERVFSEDTTYLMTDMLQTTAQTGTAKKLRSLPFPVAAKTGTVGTDKGNTDAYALSYTTRDIIGVWLGNADNSYIDCTGGGLPCNILLQINDRLHNLYQAKKEEIPPFVKPSGVVSLSLDKRAYEQARSIELSDEHSPIEYRFNELFKTKTAPTKRAKYFSHPTIESPSISMQNGKVVILFNENSPDFYQYRIERSDEKKRLTLYFGERIPQYVDDSVEKNKRYVYTVTPIYKENYGQSITLPLVNTGEGERPPLSDKEILEKDWWKY